jgi:hypothetical protein
VVSRGVCDALNGCLTCSLQDANDEATAVDLEAGSYPTYGFLVINTGNVDLTDVTIVDPDLGGELSDYTIASLAAGENATVVDVYGNPQDVTVGSYVYNEAYATALYGTTTVTSNKDKAFYKVVEAPAPDSPSPSPDEDYEPYTPDV